MTAKAQVMADKSAEISPRFNEICGILVVKSAKNKPPEMGAE
jgi:hypothetical protein